MKPIIITGGTIVNQGRSFVGHIIIRGQRIEAIGEGEYTGEAEGERIDARGMIVMPGVIDDQVHFREPGLTHKADLHSESIAAVAGGVTSFMDMPNTIPAATTIELLEQKYERAAETSVANYSFYLGASNDNIDQIYHLNPKQVCGVKVFMGSSTGNMLVDDPKALAAVFDRSPTLVATHCEDEDVIRTNIERYRAQYGDRATAAIHPLVRDGEACYRSTARAVELADRYEANLHVLHLSTARELTLFDTKPLADKKITNEVCVHHLWFTDADYARLGNLIKWNPSIKSAADRDGLREGLLNGRVDVVATDHAPHTLDEKQRSYWDAPSGAPFIQHSLVAMLEMAAQGVFTVEKVVEKMCHAPAERFAVRNRGFLQQGMFADIAIVDPSARWRVSPENILYKCGWSPLDGTELSHKVAYTIINGQIINRLGNIDTGFRGQRLEFSR